MRANRDPDRKRDSAGTSRTGDARKVVQDHLRLRARAELEKDIERNYAEDVVILHVHGVEHGHAGVRKSGRRLADQLPDADFTFDAVHVDGRFAYLEWSAASRRNRVRDGADSFVVENGRIVMQSIHFTLVSASDDAPRGTEFRESEETR